jgi:hypothetical protein
MADAEKAELMLSRAWFQHQILDASSPRTRSVGFGMIVEAGN